MLAAGHQVVALVRTPAKLPIEHPGLTLRTGQLSDAEAVRGAVTGSDAVISALGPTLATPSVPDHRDRPTLKA